MNVHSNTGFSGPTQTFLTRDAAVAHAMCELDTPVFEAHCMVVLAQDTIQGILESSQAEKTPDWHYFMMNREQFDQLHFALDQARQFVDRVRIGFSLAMKAGLNEEAV